MSTFSRRSLILGACAAGLIGICSISSASSPLQIKVYKTPWCRCCGDWVTHLQSHGIKTDVYEMEDLTPMKAHYGVRKELQSCHTAVIDGYVIEGHVPAEDIRRLIAEKPKATGLTVPGMPVGSPGMEHGDQRDPYLVLLFDDLSTTVFSKYNES